MPSPFQPISGQQAALHASGLWPFCVLMQVAEEDVHKNYCICRGFDPRVQKFIDYEEGNNDKPGIPVAKPYGSRRTGLYQIAQIFAAALPIQSSDGSASPSSVYRVPPSPTTAPIRLGQNPGKASDGHPADLDETVELLLTDEGKYINWMFLEAPASGGGLIIRFHIETADPVTRSVTASILSVPFGMTLAEMPGQETLAGIVTICDPNGCYFNEPSGELLGRDGWAVYMQPLEGQGEPCQDPGYEEPQWEVFALCCPLIACDEGA